MEFHEWLNKKFLEDALARKKRPNVSDLAKRLGISQPTASRWLNGSVKPEGDSVKRIADLFGEEVYAILGLDAPKAEAYYVYYDYADLPRPQSESQKRLFQAVFDEARARAASLPTADEQRNYIDAYLKSHGFHAASVGVSESRASYLTVKISEIANDLNEDDLEELLNYARGKLEQQKQTPTHGAAAQPDGKPAR